MARQWHVFLVCGVVAVFVGCGKATPIDRPKTVPATANFTYKGEAVAEASIAFVPAQSSSKDSRGGTGKTDATGKATIWTFESGDGVIPGDYKVTVTKMEPLPKPPKEDMSVEEYEKWSASLPPQKSLVPAKYRQAGTTDLSAKVTEGGTNDFTFELK